MIWAVLANTSHLDKNILTLYKCYIDDGISIWLMLLRMTSYNAEMRVLAGRPRARGWLSRKLAITLRVWLVLMLVYILTASQVKRQAE
jgi:hypothetical protein